jgi:protein-S-isoprenylcysteine O-methyltransferase Ste14
MEEILKITQKLKFITIVKAITPSITVVIFFTLLTFIPAGTLLYWNGWLLIGIYVIAFTPIQLYFAKNDPALFEKRQIKGEKNVFDQLISVMMGLLFISINVVSGLDYRFHWSKVPVTLSIVFSFVSVFGFLLLFLVWKQNSYASKIIEIQEEQKIIDTGLYSIVRHPMYLACTIIYLFNPIILGSWVSFIPAVIVPFFLGIRIGNEEKVLQKGLKGYDLYMKKVRYRLIPFIW